MDSGLDRRRFLRVGAAGAVAASPLAGLTSAEAAGVRPPRIPGPGQAFFGVFAGGTRPGISEPGSLENRLGRRVAVNHSFRQPPEAPWTPLRERMLRDKAAGRIPMLSYAAGEKPGIADHDMAARARIREIARGLRDDQIDGQARALKALRTPVFFRFTWEFDRRYLDPLGAAMHRNAWRRVRNRFRAVGADNVSFVWCPSWLAYGNGDASSFYPGDSYVDWIGADGYARSPDYRTFATLFTGAHAFAVRHRKPFMVCETGVHRLSTEEDTTSAPTEQSAWIDALRGHLSAGHFRNLRALLYFHVDGDDHPLPNQWRVTDPLDGPALDSFTALAWHPRMRARR